MVIMFRVLQVLVGSMIDSGLPCFQHRPDVLETLRSRFVPNMSDMQAATHMESLIENARDKWTTRAYDVSSVGFVIKCFTLNIFLVDRIFKNYRTIFIAEIILYVRKYFLN